MTGLCRRGGKDTHPVGERIVSQLPNIAGQLGLVGIPVARKISVLEEPPAPAQDRQPRKLLFQQALGALKRWSQSAQRKAPQQTLPNLCQNCAKAATERTNAQGNANIYQRTPRLPNLWLTTQPSSQSMSLRWFARMMDESWRICCSVSGLSSTISML